MNEQPTTPATATPANVAGRSFAHLAFTVFIGLSLPLVMAAMMGEQVDAGDWLIPMALPVFFALHVVLVSRAPASEVARQAADISRWDL